MKQKLSDYIFGFFLNLPEFLPVLRFLTASSRFSLAFFSFAVLVPGEALATAVVHIASSLTVVTRFNFVPTWKHFSSGGVVSKKFVTDLV